MKRIMHVNQDAMNALLPDIPPAFEKQMRDMIQSMPAERKETPMKSKLSVGFVLTVVLCLLAVSALAAALLSGGQFAEQIMVPKAKDTASEYYTPTEIDEILRIAKENGLRLDPEDEAYIRNMEKGYYKEELIRLFAKMEYGPQPAAWPLEVQRWYEEMLDACGLGDGYIHSVLPEGEEISQARALEIAAGYVRAHYDPQANLEDQALYARYMTYHENKRSPYLTVREWWISYEARDTAHADYEFTLTPAGEITSAVMRPGILAAGDQDPVHTIENRVSRQYADETGHVTYTGEIMLAEQALLKKLAAQQGTDTWHEKDIAILNTEYVIPDDTMLTREEAIQKAKAACGEQEYYTYRGYGEEALAIRVNGREVWKVTLQLKANPAPGQGNRLFVQLDARTGEILSCDTSLVSRYWYQQFLSEEMWRSLHGADVPAAETELAPHPTTQPGGLPWFWRDSRFPAWYWEKLEAVGYNGDTAGKLWNQWVNAYGEDSLFWPLEYQAIDVIWHELDSPEGAFPGLPAADEIGQEEAVRLARAQIKDFFSASISAAEADALPAGCRFWFNSVGEGIHSWEITFLRPDGPIAGSVTLDAKTGEIYHMQLMGSQAEYDAPDCPGVHRPDGAPLIHNDPRMPDSYWNEIRALAEKEGVTAENVERKYAEWLQAYGAEAFIPLEKQAIRSAYIPRAEEDTALVILPREGMISQEQALEIGWKECLALAGGSSETDTAWAKSLTVTAILLLSNDAEPTHWYVQFWEKETIPGWGDQWNSRVEIAIHAETGEIYQSGLWLNSNG